MPTKISKSILKVDGQDSNRDFSDFVDWFYSSIDTPILRGAVLEYLLVDHMIRNALVIAGSRISKLTGKVDLSQAELEDSLRHSYRTQPSGDLFDVQLHWGVTFEIKTTVSDKWRIKKTSDWDIWTETSLGRKSFQAQYYILAKLDKTSIIHSPDSVDFTKIKFYVRSGRELDEKSKGMKGVGLPVFTDKLRPCGFDELANELQKIVNAEFERVHNKFAPGWTNPDPGSDSYIPIARHTEKGVNCFWYKRAKLLQFIKNKNSKQKLVDTLWKIHRPIAYPWIETYEPSPRDWAVAGMVYVDHRNR